MESQPPQAVIFMRARSLRADGLDYEAEAAQIAHQRQACEAVARTMGWQVVREYVEHGGTGPVARRPVLGRLLDELRALHDTSYVITSAHDQLARRTADMKSIQQAIAEGGAELVTPSALPGTDGVAALVHSAYVNI